VSGQLYVPTDLPPFKVGRRLCGPQNRSGRGSVTVIGEIQRQSWWLHLIFYTGICVRAGVPTGWTTGAQFLAAAVVEFFLFATASKPALGPTQPPIQRVSETLTPEVKRPRREAWCYTTTSPIHLHNVVLS
jgi:hypothetical protein